MCFSLAEHEGDGGHPEVPEVEGGEAEQETEGAAEVRSHRREGVERLQHSRVLVLTYQTALHLLSLVNHLQVGRLEGEAAVRDGGVLETEKRVRF